MAHDWPMDTPPWQVLPEAPRQTVVSSTQRLAMDLDPRNRTIRLGLRIVTGGHSDISSGAVSRSFFSAEHAEWHQAAAWLAGDEATALLAVIAAGYHCEMRWTGDQEVIWSDEAWRAGARLYQQVATLIEEVPG